MTVYVLEIGTYEQAGIHGVYEDVEDAMRAYNEFYPNGKWVRETYSNGDVAWLNGVGDKAEISVWEVIGKSK